MLPFKDLSHSDYLINFELIHRSINNLEILFGDHLDFIKTRIKDTISSFFFFLLILIFLKISLTKKNCDLVIRKTNKGSSVVIVKKDVYLRNMETIPRDFKKSEKLKIKKGISEIFN